MRELDGRLLCLDSHGYRVAKIDGKTVKQHRYIWEKTNGPIPAGMQIDHINGEPDDNRMENLRLVTRQENMQNAKLSVNNKSGVTGVRWYDKRGKWRSQMQAGGEKIHLGYFDDWFEAVCARLSANNRYGFHTNHGRR